MNDLERARFYKAESPGKTKPLEALAAAYDSISKKDEGVEATGVVISVVYEDGTTGYFSGGKSIDKRFEAVGLLEMIKAAIIDSECVHAD